MMKERWEPIDDRTPSPLGRFIFLLGVTAAGIATIGCNPAPSKAPSQFSAVISGNSMEPSLSGGRFLFQCEHCGFNGYFSVPLPQESEAAHQCPRCNFPIEFYGIHDVDTLQLQPRPLADMIERGDVASFFTNDLQSSPLQVKRVAALPGEQLSIFGGDLFVNGRRDLASFDLFRSRAVFVDSIVLSPETLQSEWLQYHGSSLYPRVGPELKRHRSSITDECYWLPSESRDLATVPDLLILFELQQGSFPVSTSMRVQFFYYDHVVQLDALVTPKSIEVTAHVDDDPGKMMNLVYSGESDALAMGCIDGRPLAATNLWQVAWDEVVTPELETAKLNEGYFAHVADVDQTAGPFGFVASPEPIVDLLAPVAFQYQSIQPNSVRVSLHRDLFYRGGRNQLSFDFPKSEAYQMLGDSIATSLDSRQAYPLGIPRTRIKGTIKVADLIRVRNRNPTVRSPATSRVAN